MATVPLATTSSRRDSLYTVVPIPKMKDLSYKTTFFLILGGREYQIRCIIMHPNIRYSRLLIT